MEKGEAMRLLTILCLTPFLFGLVRGAIVTKSVEYNDGSTVLEGYLAYDDSLGFPRPGVLIVHEWTGLGDYVKGRAEQLAKLGYVAFAVDIYGKGIRPQTPEEASAQAAIYRQDRPLMRRRITTGLDWLRQNKLVDPARIAAIGYCFGGGVVLELARSSAAIAGVVSFHGNLDTPHPEDAKNIKAPVLVLHGADDPYVGPEQVTPFEKEMRGGGVDWRLVLYGGAVHSFTNPASGNDPSKGVAYNALADRRSWDEMRRFFDEIFGS
jgi:dienelactone hydrolase